MGIQPLGLPQQYQHCIPKAVGCKVASAAALPADQDAPRTLGKCAVVAALSSKALAVDAAVETQLLLRASHQQQQLATHQVARMALVVAHAASCDAAQVQPTAQQLQVQQFADRAPQAAARFAQTAGAAAAQKLSWQQHF